MTLLSKASVEALIDLKIESTKERLQRQKGRLDSAQEAVENARIGALSVMRNHLGHIEPAFTSAFRLVKEQGYEIKNVGYIHGLIEHGPGPMIREIDRLTNKIVAIQKWHQEHGPPANTELYDLIYK